jgi:hypothetical protein
MEEPTILSEVLGLAFVVAMLVGIVLAGRKLGLRD